MNNVLILSPHTDDAEIGCGGTIIRLLQEKKNLLWVVFSTAEDSIPDDMPKDILTTEFLEVMKKLELDESHFIIKHFKVRNLKQHRQEILEILVDLKKTFKPDMVIGPSLNDFHQDHSVIANEMVRAFKTSSSIICYELPWNHIKFDTQFFMTLSPDHIAKKISLLETYKSQIKIDRHYFSADFVKGLATTRGSQVAEKYAEAFEVIRWINRY
ncbi:MAG: PIG-L family deacetylase [Bacteroidota bacterium]|jgi:LmbE family N-acetylglucosaminyl deacetylase